MTPTSLALTLALAVAQDPAQSAQPGPAPAGPALERTARPLADRDARALGVGAFARDATGLDLAGAPASWRSALGERGAVVAFTSLSCPLCQKLAPALARTEERARGVGFGFVHVAVSGLDSAEDLAQHADTHGLAGAVLRDSDGHLAAAFDVRTTTEVFVVDAAGTLRYRGAINDQYGLGYAHTEPRQAFLDDALRALLRGTEPAVAATTAPGCLVERDAAPHADHAVTYTRDISRLVQRSCLECHRTGGVAPFSLDSYESVARRATMSLASIDAGTMPPWFAAPVAHGTTPWMNDRSLTPSDRELFAAWIAAGKPRGDESELPLPREFAAEDSGWSLGEPDAVYTLPRAFTVPAEGRIAYQYTAVPTGLTADRWVSAIEVRPGARDVVHHVLVYPLPEEAFEGGRLRRWDLLDERRGFFAAWAPGAAPVVLPPGHARELRAGTVLMFELHYTPNGREVQDRTSIGVHFASDDPAWQPTHVVRTAGISGRGLRVPAGAKEHVERSTGITSAAVRIEAFMPHMHLRGAAFRFDLVEPDRPRTTLLEVPRYDFNWQLRYELVEPLTLPAGARIDVRGVFDNSADNPANPNPKTAVRWGPETDDEMLIGFVDYVLVEEDLTRRADDPAWVVLEPNMQSRLRRIAAENGGVVPRAAIPPAGRRDFDALDRDTNGVLSAAELPIL